MSERFDLRSINHFVLIKQHLAGGSADTQLSQLVQDLGGLPAENAMTPYLTLAARLPDFQPKALEKQLYKEPVMALIRCVRKSLYVHNAGLLSIMFAATSKKTIKSSENMMLFRGVSMSEYKVLSESILKLLKKRQLTTPEIKDSLATDFDISAVIDYMSDQGVLVRTKPAAGWKDKGYRYGIFSEVFPDVELGAIEERQAILKLVRYYLKTFGPATLNDINWWTGLGNIRVRSALRALGDEIREIRTTDFNTPMVMIADELEPLRASISAQGSTVTLLPSCDSYVMGYSDRQRYVDDELQEYVVDNAGNITNIILVNGRTAGVWDCSPKATDDFQIFLFDYQQAAVSELIRTRAKRLGMLMYDRDVRIRQVEKMLPLNKQPAGAFISPLNRMEV